MFFRTQVAEGAKLLDQHAEGWQWAVDVKKLDMHSLGYCMLGQLYHNYWDGVSTLNIYEREDEYGFCGPKGIAGFAASFIAYALLKRAWVREIKLRRANSRPAHLQLKQRERQLVSA